MTKLTNSRLLTLYLKELITVVLMMHMMSELNTRYSITTILLPRLGAFYSTKIMGHGQLNPRICEIKCAIVRAVELMR